MYRSVGLTVLTASLLLALIAGTVRAVSHERNLIWAQKDERTGVARLVGVTGDPHVWVVNRTATTKYVTAPNKQWRFTALAFNYRRHTIYWSDAGNKKIQGLRLNGGHAAFTIFGGTSGAVGGVTSDWVMGNVYWTDARYNWVVVAPARRDSTFFNVIVKTGLDRPAGIAVLPQKGLLFWSDWGLVPKIERSTCAGEGRRMLVSDDVMRPLGMVLDHKANLLYWVDGSKGTVESIDIYGNNRQTNFYVEGANFYGITLYKKYIFATEQTDGQLYVFDGASERHEVKFSTGARPYDVLMYDDNIQTPTQDPCTEFGCDHICISAGSARAQCLCAMGYVLQPDDKTCADDGRFGTPQFIYSIGTALCRFPGNMADMSLTNVSLDTQCFLTHRRVAMALTAHVRQDAVYLAENTTRTISRLKLVEGAGPEVIVGGTGSVEGLALDWVSSNLYWTDSAFRQIMVSRADGRFQTPLVTSQLSQPRGIAVDAVNSKLYWTDVGPEAKIERAQLDGSNRTLFISTDLGSPNQVVLDLRTNTLCWSDSITDRLECVGLDGENRRVVTSQPGTDMYGVTVFQDFIVWTDRGKRNGIHAGIRETGEKVRGIIHPGIGVAYDVITYDISLQPLIEGACGDNNGGCEHLCLATPGGETGNYKCKCAMGFMLGSDGVSCAADAYYDNFVLFTDTYQKQIYQMALSSASFHAVPLTGHNNPIAVDYDPIGRRVYWTDVADKVIKCAFVNGTDETVVRHLDERSIPDGLALEVSSRLAYYTDTGLKVIGAVTLETGHHRVIIDDFLDQPRAIVLDPGRGHMYWTDWGLHSRIEKASMDGSSRRRVVNTGLGAWPNGLAIDTQRERLYWCDARSDQIESSNLDGLNRRAIYRDEESHFFGLAALDGVIYYTDWTKKSIMKLEQIDGEFTSSPLGSAKFARLNDIHVYRSNSLDRRYSENACGFRNGGCSHLCLPVPSGRTCACPKGMRLVSGYRCVITTVEEETTPKAVAIPTRVTQPVPTVRRPAQTSPRSLPPDVATLRQSGSHTQEQSHGDHGLYGNRVTAPSITDQITSKATPQTETAHVNPITTVATTTATTTTKSSPRANPRPPLDTRPPLTSSRRPTDATTLSQTSTTPLTTPPTAQTDTTPPPISIPSFSEASTVQLTSPSKGSTISTTQKTTVEPRKTSTKQSQRPSHSNVGEHLTSGRPTATLRSTEAGASQTTGQKKSTPFRSYVTDRSTTGGSSSDITVEPTVPNNTSSVPRQLTPTDRLDDFEFSMFALLAIIVGGIVLMCLIIVSGVLLYRKMDPGNPHRRRRTGSVQPALSSLSDIYEMPTKDRQSHFVDRPASRYGFLHDRYYNGTLDSAGGIDAVNTYEEIFEAVGDDRTNPTFSTFR